MWARWVFVTPPEIPQVITCAGPHTCASDKCTLRLILHVLIKMAAIMQYKQTGQFPLSERPALLGFGALSLAKLRLSHGRLA